MNDDTMTCELLAAGKLTQRCPICTLVEAAGRACTRCGAPTGPADWFRATLSEPHREAIVAGRANRRHGLEVGSTCLQAPRPGVPEVAA